MSNLDPSLARAIILATSFRGDEMHRCQAALLMIGLHDLDFNAGDLPGEICNGDQRLAGMACASLQVQGMLICVGRIKSSNPLANGRKVNLWRLTGHAKARTWLSRHGFPSKDEAQMSLAV